MVKVWSSCVFPRWKPFIYIFLRDDTHIRGKKCSFFGKFGVLYFLETLVLRFVPLPYYRRLRCLTSESIGKFLVNNILMFESARFLVMAQIHFSSIKKNKDWTSRTLATPHPPTSDNISVLHFLPQPSLPAPPQSGHHMCITPKSSIAFCLPVNGHSDY